MKTQIKQKIDDKHILPSFSFDKPTLSYYISDVFIIVSQTRIFVHEQLRSLIHIIFYQKRGLAKHNPRFVTCRSSFWCSQTLDSALTRFSSRRTYSLHVRSLWQTYICLLLFVWSLGRPSPFATSLVLSWATASCCWICCTSSDTRKCRIHIELSHRVVWHTARCIIHNH